MRIRMTYRVGAVYSHCIGHAWSTTTGEEPLPGPNQGSPRAAASVSHNWIAGPLRPLLPEATGARWETARKIADHYGVYGNQTTTSHQLPHPRLASDLDDGGMRRRATQKFYLNAAPIIVERVLERQTEEAALGSVGWRLATAYGARALPVRAPRTTAT